jgi:voltage-gated potassium channel
MNRRAPKTLRWRFFVAFRRAVHVTWPVLSAILAFQLALGSLTGFVEGWSVGDTVYFTFITGLTIGYGDLVPRHALTRALAIGIGFSGVFVMGLVAAIAVHALRSALIDGGSGSE